MNSETRRAVLSWTAVAIWAGFIFFMSTHTGESLNKGSSVISAIFQVLDEWQARMFGAGADFVSSTAHFLEYALLGLLLANALSFHGLGVDVSAETEARAFAIRQRSVLRRVCLLAVLLASLYGVTDEVHQWFVPDRFADPADWLVDTLGASFGTLVFSRLIARIQQ